MGENGWTAVPVRPETHAEITRLKAHPRQTYDEVLRALIALWRKTNGDRTVVLDDVPRDDDPAHREPQEATA